ncbi:tectonin beta-propeller repeat-containing protein 1-like isoform X1 [Branchiostoma lanceolatum]|uniref:tectonin beta-propeller repeat-containing protein 1-like isoform X1 n=1 Tax=Branchiostoma lanceolatum TaxID=7740 RepID=UPI003453E799
MPATYLWSVDSAGKVYTLSTGGRQWEEVKGDIELKRVTATEQCAWGIGCDHQVYLYVHSREVPIRCQEATYENQRWNPMEGFSGQHLLPTDRWHWSNQQGTQLQPKDSCTLPSPHWSWEDDWYIDENIRGEPTDKGGWQYAVDFPAQYGPKKRWNSCVRRRKWIRYRRYHATDNWALIPGVFEDPLKEPFIDVAAGGAELTDQPPGRVSVWTVTIMGRIFYRTEVHAMNPEGVSWQEVDNEGRECTQISLGPSCLLWAVTWDGEVMVRVGITRDNPIGTSWQVVAPPREDVHFLQVSVGVKGVWAVSRGDKVWSRKGVDATGGAEDQAALVGSAWVEMVGAMALISVGPNDQVWSLDANDRYMVYFRKGVTPSELSGKTWKALEISKGGPASMNSSVSSSMSDIYSQSNMLSSQMDRLQVASDSFPDIQPQASRPNLASDSFTDSTQKGGEKAEKFEDSQDSKATHSLSEETSKESKKKKEGEEEEEDNKERKALHESYNSDISDTVVDFTRDYVPQKQGAGSNNKEAQTVRTMENTPKGKAENTHRTLEGSPENSRNAICGSQDSGISKGNMASSTESVDARTSNGKRNPVLEKLQQEDESQSESSGSRRGSATSFTGIDMYADLYQPDPAWVWVSGGGCVIDTFTQPNWFTAAPSHTNGRGNSMLGPLDSMAIWGQVQINDAPWRKRVLLQLHERTTKELQPFQDYEQAIERTSWIKKGSLQYWSDTKPHRWVDCRLHLEQSSGKGLYDCKFTCYYKYYDSEKYLQFPLSEIVCVLRVNHGGNQRPVLAIYTAKRTAKKVPVRLACSTEKELEDWLTAISLACCELQGCKGAPTSRAVWSTTCRGDIFVYEPTHDMEITPANQMFWRQMGGHLNMVECGGGGVVWGVGFDGTGWVYTGGYGGGMFKGIASSPGGIHTQTDVKYIYIYENQRWNPMTGFSDRGFPTDRYMWSDITGRQECTKEGTKTPTTEWHWVGDWTIDYKPPGGADKKGWQYATDFPASYHGYKGWNDYVRRRRWMRKAKIVTTGPWMEAPPQHLKDISVQVDQPESSTDPIALWAIGVNGDVLCRMGVIQDFPQGVSWLHVPTDQPMSSVSVGGNNRVWVTAQDGSAFFRNGITQKEPQGTCWFHIPSPHNRPLVQVSVGESSVWAVDKFHWLWFRTQVTSTFPEGTRWDYLSPNVKKVSVGPQDQVWIIAEDSPEKGTWIPMADEVMDKVKEKVWVLQGYVPQGSRGVVGHRLGVKIPEIPIGKTWDTQGIGGGWIHLSIRACTVQDPPTGVCTDDAAATVKGVHEEGDATIYNSQPVC